MKLYKFENILNEIASVFDIDQWDVQANVFTNTVKDFTDTDEMKIEKLLKKNFLITSEEEISTFINLIVKLFPGHLKDFEDLINYMYKEINTVAIRLSEEKSLKEFSKKLWHVITDDLIRFVQENGYNFYKNMPEITSGDNQEFMNTNILFIKLWIDFMPVTEIYISKWGNSKIKKIFK